ncbi:hypothetical protein LSH36_11g12001 [Paralvinella palmiformis]|uniref:VWFA domain-containing protein n=1 Tax=Paralvinella palmiformis TaxID=53620 RepID=A0AAD9KDV1_9ANNE|nr:hypothetical protein LSH36_11g12001 [Paralvinella palmiformis]
MMVLDDDNDDDNNDDDHDDNHDQDDAMWRYSERLQNCHNEERSLDLTYFCSNIKDKINVVLALKPVEPPVRRYGTTEPPKVVPMRLVCVIDVSHSMAEPYGPDDDVSKLDKVKMFIQLLIHSLNNDDYLSIVTFGTVSNVIFPLTRMSRDGKVRAERALDDIRLGGVTNLSAGIFTGIDQFNSPFAKSRYFDDNIILFTDGMANEGIVETDEMVAEVRKRMKDLKEECHFERDYTIKICTMGTGGFLPEAVYSIGSAFSSDAFYFLEEDSNLELNMMKPVLFRQNGLVSSISVVVTPLNGVTLNVQEMTDDYLNPELESSGNTPDGATYFIHDICVNMYRHIVCSLLLPKKHKKLLKGKDVLRLVVEYRNATMQACVIEKTVTYEELPRKDVNNKDPDLAVNAVQNSRMSAQRMLNDAALAMKKLDRTTAKNLLQDGVNEIRSYLELVDAQVASEESHLLLNNELEPILVNLENCTNYLGDFTVRWDDAWGRIKALSSSIAREVPTASGIYVHGAELYNAPKVQDKLSELCDKLKDIYTSLGLATDTIDRYFGVVKELEGKLEEKFNETSV